LRSFAKVSDDVAEFLGHGSEEGKVIVIPSANPKLPV
jgi:hypothetical protein